MQVSKRNTEIPVIHEHLEHQIVVHSCSMPHMLYAGMTKSIPSRALTAAGSREQIASGASNPMLEDAAL